MNKKGCLFSCLGWLFIASGIYGLFHSPVPGVVCLVIGVLLLKNSRSKPGNASPSSTPPETAQAIETPKIAPGFSPEIPRTVAGSDGSSFGSWDISIHDAEGQDVRFDRAMYQRISILSFDSGSGKAVIQGTHGTYETTLDSCTCEDFQRRGLPCKHIYKLALSSGYSADAFYSARSDVVWYAENCRVYHSCPDCRGLRNRYSRRATVSMAKYKGLRPCKTCCEIKN